MKQLLRLSSEFDKVLQALVLASLALVVACTTALEPTLASTPAATPLLAGASPFLESTATAPTPIPSPKPASPNKLGVHLLLDDGRNVWPTELWLPHMLHARQAVGEWGYVTELVRIDDLEPTRWQLFMDICTHLHLTPILRLATTYDNEGGWWVAPQADEAGGYRTVAALYADFAAALRWPTPDHHIIVGNEPNHGNEWGGRPDPAAYTRFLIDVADALHAADPGARVMNAGFDPFTPHTGDVPFSDGLYYMDEETFLDQMCAADPDVFTRLDIWASHSYPTGPLTDGPWQQEYRADWLNGAANPNHLPPPPGVYNRGVNGYEWELFKLSSLGVQSLPVIITETGWRHAESADPDSTDNGRPLPDSETVATYLDLALWGNGGRYPEFPQSGWTPWLADPRVVAVTPFALDGSPAEWGHTNWLVLDSHGSVLDTYAPFDLLATHSAQQ